MDQSQIQTQKQSAKTIDLDSEENESFEADSDEIEPDDAFEADSSDQSDDSDNFLDELDQKEVTFPSTNISHARNTIFQTNMNNVDLSAENAPIVVGTVRLTPAPSSEIQTKELEGENDDKKIEFLYADSKINDEKNGGDSISSVMASAVNSLVSPRAHY